MMEEDTGKSSMQLFTEQLQQSLNELKEFCGIQTEEVVNNKFQEKLLDLKCDVNNDFVGNLEVFNIKEDKFPQQITNLLSEKNSWGETFRIINFPEQVLASNELSYMSTAVIVDWEEMIKDKPNEINLNGLHNDYSLITLTIHKYINSNLAKTKFNDEFENIKQSQLINANIGEIGEHSVSYYSNASKYKAYSSKFRINNIIFTISEPSISYYEENYLHSEEQLKEIIEDIYFLLCDNFE
jgi:hypothetical protein